MAGTNSDEEFGDFTFASFPSSGGRSTAGGDDVWGDFVESSSPGSGSTHVSTKSKPLDPFEFFPHKPNPPSQSVTNQWMKPKGALPLSIFGEPEENLEVPTSSSPVKSEGKKDSNLYSENQMGLNVNSIVSRSNSAMDFSFQIHEMEKETPISGFSSHGRRSLTDMGSSFGLLLPQDSSQSKPVVSGLNLGSDLLGGFNSGGISGVDLKADLFGSNTEFDAFTNGYGPSQHSKHENGFSLSSNSPNWNSNTIDFKPSVDGLITDAEALADNGDFDDDDDGWEFKDASSTFKVENGNEKVDIKEQTKSEVNMFSSVFGNGSNDQSIGLFSSSNGFSETIKDVNRNSDFKPTPAAMNGFPSDLLFETDPITAENVPKSDHLSSNNEEFDTGDDDEWEFKDANLQKFGDEKDRVDRKEQTKSEVNMFSSAFGNGSNDQSIDLFSSSNGFSETVKDVNRNSDFKPTTAALDGFPSDSLFETDPITAENVPKFDHPSSNNEEFDTGDDDEWEFKDANLQKFGDEKDQVNKKELANSEANMFSPVHATGSNEQSIDLFALSNGFFEKAGEVDNNSYFKPPPEAPNGFSSDSLFETEPSTAENGPKSPLPHGISKEYDGDDNDEWEFKDAYLDKVGDGKNQANEKVIENHKGALPLSIFGDDEVENDSPEVQDGFTYNPSSLESGIRSQGSNVAIHDLISNLYSQAEQIASVDNTERTAGSGSASEKNIDPILVGDDDGFDGTSWEFKDASSQVGSGDQTLLSSPSDPYQSVAIKLELNNYVDFYCKLKDKLSFVCRCHLNNLKVTQHADSFSGGDTEIAAIEEEIQAFEELHEDVVKCKEITTDEPLKDDILTDFLVVLREEKFRLLESQYQLSRRLQLAVKDFRSAVDLLNHAKSVLNVLTIGSAEDQNMYTSTWSKMISVCALELKHGLQIWKQLTEKNFTLLNDARGKRNIIALAEIYRVVLILEASMKLYRPWTLSSSLDSSSIYGLIEECNLLWSNSGVEEALEGIISEPLDDIEYHSTVEALLGSIKSVHDVDGHATRDDVSSHEVSTCRLSLLGSEAVPGMKTVSWSGECYFLTLANLWGNLISCDPPKLPHLHIRA